MNPPWAGSNRRWVAAALCTTILLLLTTCSDSDPTTLYDSNLTSGLYFTVVSGDQQHWIAGYELPDPIVVMATDQKGKPVKDQLVNFRVISGGGSVFAGAAKTDGAGIAQDYWALGTNPGENVLEVRAVDPTTGEKHVYAQLKATGYPGAEDLAALSRLFGHDWVLALAGQIEENEEGVGEALKIHFEEIVLALQPAGVLADLDEALTEIEVLLATPSEDNPVEYAFLSHVTRFCRDRFDAVMQSIPAL